MKPLLFTLLFSGCTLLSFGQSNTPISIEYLKAVPAEIDGCSEMLTYDSTPVRKAKYIFVSDLQEIAFMRLSGKLVRLKRTAHQELSSESNKSVYQGDGYTVTVLTRTIKELGEEVVLEVGTIKVHYKNQQVIVRIHGEAGC